MAEALTAYSLAVGEHMWTWDSGPGPDKVYDNDYLRVPVEWEVRDPERARHAYADLNVKLDTLVEALKQLFRVMHEFEPEGAHSGSDRI